MNRSIIVEGRIGNINACSSPKYIWILNGLSLDRYSKYDFKCEHVLMLPVNFMKIKKCGFFMYYAEHRVFIVSEENGETAIINEDTYACKFIKVFDCDFHDKNYHFSSTFNNNRLFIIPKSGRQILIMDKNGYLSTLGKWQNEIENMMGADEKVCGIIPYSFYIYNGEGYFLVLSGTKEYVVRIDCEAGIEIITSLSRENGLIRKTVCLDNYVWLDVFESSIPKLYKVDKRSGEVIDKVKMPKELSDVNYLFVKDGRIFITNYENWYGFFDPMNGEITSLFSDLISLRIIGINVELEEIIAIDYEYLYLIDIKNGKTISQERHLYAFDLNGFVLNM